MHIIFVIEVFSQILKIVRCSEFIIDVYIMI